MARAVGLFEKFICFTILPSSCHPYAQAGHRFYAEKQHEKQEAACQFNDIDPA